MCISHAIQHAMLSSSVTGKKHRAPLSICAFKKGNAKKDM